MPELPEVETVVRGLRASLVGRTIVGVEVRWARSVIPPNPTAFARRLTGQAVAGVGRRGKWVVIALSDGDTLLVQVNPAGPACHTGAVSCFYRKFADEESHV